MTTTTCHAGSATTKANAGAATKRRVRATVLAIAATLGHSDGSTYADCVACGHRATIGLGAADVARFELGHVTSDANGGRYCPCNLLPLCRACNADMGARDLTDVLTPRYDARATWSGVMVSDPGATVTASDVVRGEAAWLPA